MPRPKKYSDVRRMLLRKLLTEPDDKLVELRDYIWDSLIVRRFMRGKSIVDIAQEQPMRRADSEIEHAIRRVMRRPKR